MKKSLATIKNEESYDLHAKEWQAAMDTNLGHIYLEKPAMIKLLPKSLKNKTVLCIGVGSGEELESLIERGTDNITAIDISNELIKLAAIKFPNVHFQAMDMMNLSFENEQFDFIYSSLAFHYSDDWDKLLEVIYRVMKKDGVLLFSTHRPEFWNRMDKTGNGVINDRGVSLTEHTSILPGDVNVIFYNHISTEAILDSIIHSGFKIVSVETPAVIAPDLLDIFDQEQYEKLKRKNSEDPIFLVILVTKL